MELRQAGGRCVAAGAARDAEAWSGRRFREAKVKERSDCSAFFVIGGIICRASAFCLGVDKRPPCGVPGRASEELCGSMMQIVHATGSGTGSSRPI